MTDRPTLMSLPPELRELIWTFAVVQPEPMPAFLEQRTVLVREHPHLEDARREGLTVTRQERPRPGLPGLVFVSRAVCVEATRVFFRDNTFLVALSANDQHEIRRWLDHSNVMLARLIPCSPLLRVESYINIRLEFRLCTSADKIIKSGTIDCRPHWLSESEPDRTLLLEFGGVLANGCTCSIVAETQILCDDNRVDDAPIGAFVSLIADKVADDEYIQEDRLDWELKCRQCGKPSNVGLGANQ